MNNLAQAFALRPDALDVTADYMGLLGFGGSELETRLEGLIGLSVAHTLSCHYMAVTHRRCWRIQWRPRKLNVWWTKA